MISDATIFVSCDRCQERIEFNFGWVADHDDWKTAGRFKGWFIGWKDPDGGALCPGCDEELNSALAKDD